ncbi:major facilitator superfamily domain-containing protein [Trichoderma evansii]
MDHLVRDTAFGMLVRWVTRGRFLKYPEDQATFQCPTCYNPPVVQRAESASGDEASSAEMAPVNADLDTHLIGEADCEDQEISRIVSRPQMSRVETASSLAQAYDDATRQETVRSMHSIISPKTTENGIILVDWYTTDDQDNPQNWSKQRKLFTTTQLYLYTLSVYMGSAIITPSEPKIITIFGVSPELASMSLSMYVLGYGVGPLLFSPLSEIPIIGRNPPYILTYFAFILISIGTAVVNNFPGLIVLRFLQGFFGSPCLATSGASFGDMLNLIALPYALAGWGTFATAGPAIGPLVSGFSVAAENWHWSLWEIVWTSAPIFVLMFFFLPETSSATILLQRAKRLRRLTGRSDLRSQSEMDQHKLTVHEVIVQNLWRPFEINILDPSVLFTSLYTGLMYGIFYSFFEVFPFVYTTGLPGLASPTHGYGMNEGELGLIFISISVGVVLSLICYATYLRYVFEPSVLKHGFGEPERRLIPGLIGCFLVPIGLFLFGWTGNSSPKIPWIVPTIGVVFINSGIYIILMVIFIYVALSYPMYSASLFAANDAVRSSLGVAAIHFSRPLFINLGVGKGTSLLAGLSCAGVIGIFTLYVYGAALRRRSRFAVK